MMTSKQIILKVQEEKSYRSVRSMELDLGVRVGFLSDIIRGEKRISEECAAKIRAKYPDISREWLMSGEGYMYEDQARREKAESNFIRLERELREQIEDLRRHIKDLESDNAFLRDAAIKAGVLNYQMSQINDGHDKILRDINDQYAAIVKYLLRLDSPSMVAEDLPGTPSSHKGQNQESPSHKSHKKESATPSAGDIANSIINH